MILLVIVAVAFSAFVFGFAVGNAFGSRWGIPRDPRLRRQLDLTAAAARGELARLRDRQPW